MAVFQRYTRYPNSVAYRLWTTREEAEKAGEEAMRLDRRIVLVEPYRTSGKWAARAWQGPKGPRTMWYSL